MATLTVTASEARANFSKLGEEIARTKKPVTVFKNSKPWLVIVPATEVGANGGDRVRNSDLSEDETALLTWADSFVSEYREVFEALAK